MRESTSTVSDLTRLCIHTQTFRDLELEDFVWLLADHGVPAASVWRHTLEGRKLSQTRQMIEQAGLRINSLVRGGFFAYLDPAFRETAIKDNLDAIEQAGSLGAPLLVLVCGADPVQSLDESRQQVKQGIETILPAAEKAGVRLALEPLHPMYADTRSAIVTMKQANDMVADIGSGHLGIAVDVYHLWWDQELQQEIRRCGQMNKLFAFHVCDWKVPTTDMLEDRGLMGEGCIDIPAIRSWVEQAGFTGFIEVEIFSRIYWAMNPVRYMEQIKRSYLSCV